MEKKFGVPFSGAADLIIGGAEEAAKGTPLYSYRNSKPESTHEYLDSAPTGSTGYELMGVMKTTKGA